MSSSDQYKAIRDIADAICEEDVSPEQIEQLEQLLKNDPDAMDFYLDYVGIHTYLSSSAQRNVKYIYRRISTAEEFVIEPAGEEFTHQTALDKQRQTDINQIQPTTEVLTSSTLKAMHSGNKTQQQSPSSNFKKRKVILGALLVLLCFIATFITWALVDKYSDQFRAKIVSGELSTVNWSHIKSEYLYVGEYQTNEDSKIKLPSGETISFDKNSAFKLLNNNAIQLTQGKISLTAVADHNLRILGPNFALSSNGEALTLDLGTEQPTVTTSEHTLLTPSHWRPIHFWPFEGQADRALDSAGTAHGVYSYGATRAKGLVGQGAFDFDNSFNARIDVGSGGGTVPASGSFAVTEGVTIEALIQPEYSGQVGDMDEIFRKDQSDQELRMLLSFQHDIQHKSYLKPDGHYKESLSFGLYLVGQGYHELKLPLDGLHGRPTLEELKDGTSHHVVASYDVKTGIKAIYLNGVRHVSYQYPPGSRMLSGGSGAANIGNSPNLPVPVRPTDVRFANNEGFSGVIDEVAFYNFALPAYMVKQHYDHVRQNKNYFGLVPSSETLPEKIQISLPAHSRVELDKDTGLPLNVISR